MHLLNIIYFGNSTDDRVAGGRNPQNAPFGAGATPIRCNWKYTLRTMFSNNVVMLYYIVIVLSNKVVCCHCKLQLSVLFYEYLL